MRRILVIAVVLVVLAGLSMTGIGRDLKNERIPTDVNNQTIDNLIGIGVDYKVTASTDPVQVSATLPLLVYGVSVASDGSGTDWCKVVSTYTTASVTDALTIDEIQSTTTAQYLYEKTPVFVPASANYCYVVVNDTNTFGKVLYMEVGD